VLRRLGMMPNIALGHDERDATPLPVLHASGFLRWTPEVRSPARWPVSIGRSVSVGHGQSEMARATMANCVAIHEAFIQHTPERFADLIAEDAIWVDVPTGEVLNGAAAAAHHDHGNWMTAFPDSSAEITNLTGNEDWVAVQHRGFGTHLGELRLGGQVYQPTGRPVEIRVLDLVQYRGGRAVLIRNYYDMAVMLTQLGVIPT
jgi:ketosteroid isomerase-like protein